MVPYQQSMYLQCSKGGAIQTIDFASYGTALGSCGNFSFGKCHLSNSSSIIASACLGKNSCAVNVTSNLFPDPCVGTLKWLTVQVHCSDQTNNTHWNFTLIDPLMEDFLAATLPRNVTVNFSTTPQWLWVTPTPTPVPTDPMAVDWKYSSGTACKRGKKYWAILHPILTSFAFSSTRSIFPTDCKLLW